MMQRRIRKMCTFVTVLLVVCFCAGLFSCKSSTIHKDISEKNSFVSSEHQFLDDDSMKTIGLIGGVSWVSSLEYYRLMNELVQEELGGLHSAEVLLYSIEFGEFSKQERLAHLGDWTPLKNTLLDAAKRLEMGGADFIVIASNTINSLVDDIQPTVSIPVLHIADAVGEAIQKENLKKVALLGTSFTMEQDFYKDILRDKYQLEVVVPDDSERSYINEVIFDELCANRFFPESKERFIQIIQRLIDEEKIEGVILGCTEIPLLVHKEDVPIPVFDSTRIHVEAAVDYALDTD